jgi:rubrerythrin
MKKELTPVELIGLAVKREEQAHDFYEMFAGRIKNELVKAKYLSLAEEETKHKHLLVKLYHQMIGEKKDPPSIPGDDSIYGADVPDITDIEKLMELAISKEEEARKFYLDSAVKMNSQSSRRLLEYLADMERGHALVLKTEHDAYLRDANWYADNPDVQLVGP